LNRLSYHNPQLLYFLELNQKTIILFAHSY